MNASATFTAQDGTTTTRKYAHGWTAGNAARKALLEGRAVSVRYTDLSRNHTTELTRHGNTITRRTI